MMASLPGPTTYTYAADISTDEAVAAGAHGVTFSQPVVFYVDNFLHAPVGTPVPLGAYDGQASHWESLSSAFVVQVLADGRVDATGDGQADADFPLAPGEAASLLAHFPAGTQLVRGVTTHFSGVDANWAWRCVGSCSGAASISTAHTEECPTCKGGSIIDVHNQHLSEAMAVPGTPLTLLYHSHRAAARPQRLHLTATALPDGGAPVSSVGARFTLDVAGQHFEADIDGGTVGTTQDFVWDGKDAWGRTVGGVVPATVGVGYGYGGVYVRKATGGGAAVYLDTSKDDFVAWPAADAVTLSATRDVAWIMTKATFAMGDWLSREGLGGLSVDKVHGYSGATGTLFLGDGTQFSTGQLGLTLKRVVGGGSASGDDISALDADLYSDVAYLAEGPDGTVYFVEYGRRIRALTKTGRLKTVAGSTSTGFSGDGGPATQALFNTIRGLSADSQGNLFVADSKNHRLRRIDAVTGVVTTVCGTGTRGFSADGTDALAAQLDTPENLLVDVDGSLLFFTWAATTNAGLLLRRLHDGRLTTVAGGTESPTLEASTPLGIRFDSTARRLALGPDGSLYVAGDESYQGGPAYVVRRLGADGRVTLVGGGGASTNPDETNALSTCLSGVGGLAVDGDGTVYVSETGGTGCKVRGAGVRAISSTGLFGTAAGQSLSAPTGVTPTDGLAQGVPLFQASDVLMRRDGSLLVVVRGNKTTLHALTAPATTSLAERAVPSRDGSEVYVFDVTGRHLRTLDSVTSQVAWTFAWDSGGRLTSLTDRDGNRTTVLRDAAGAPTGLQGPDGQVTSLELDAAGRVTAVKDAASRKVSLAYGSDGLLSDFTDANGHTSHFQYDDEGRLTSDSNALGHAQTLARKWAGGGSIVTHTTPEGHATTYEVVGDGNTRRMKTTLPWGAVDVMTWKGASLQVDAADGSGTSVLFQSDARFGTSSWVPASVSVAMPSGLTSTSSLQRAVSVDTANPLHVTQWADTVTLDGKVWRQVYTDADKTLRLTSPLGRSSLVTLDAAGRPVTLQTPGALPLSLQYDARGRPTTVTQGPRSATVAWGSDGFVESVTDALSQRLAYTRDATGRVTQVTTTGGSTLGLATDAVGQLTTATAPAGDALTWGYSAANEVTSWTPPLASGQSAESWSYDKDSAVSSSSALDGSQTTVTRDDSGRVVTVTSPWATTSAAWDAVGRLSELARGQQRLSYTYDGPLLLQEATAGVFSGAVAWAYDASFRVASESVGGQAIHFAYDDDGALVTAGAESLTYDATTGFLVSVTSGVVTEAYTYDEFGAVKGQTVAVGGAVLFSRALTRDAVGRVVREATTASGTTHTLEYGYDTERRLASQKTDGVATNSWAYDVDGRRTAADGVSSTWDAAGRQVTSGGTTYGWDVFGSLASRTTSAGTTTYTHDGDGHLLHVVSGGVTMDHTYDARGRRVAKSRNGVVTGWLYDSQWRVIAEVDGTGAVTKRFVYASLGNSPDLMVAGGHTYRLLHDERGSVLAVVDVASGAVAEVVSYSVWGEVLTDSAPGLVPLKYAGGVYDSDTGLTHFGARDYDATQGRWVQSEPLSRSQTYVRRVAQSGMSVPTYAYAANNPLRYVDRDGLRVVLMDARAQSLAYGLRQNATGRQLYDWLDASPSEYRVFGEAPIPLDEVGRSTGKFRPGLARGGQCQQSGGQIDLFDRAVRAAGTDPIANLAHELTHAALYDNETVGRPFMPPFVYPLRNESVNGALPPGAHKAMDVFWQTTISGVP
jgi:RHS repeat-associated protein